jgi:hypothetical protein
MMMVALRHALIDAGDATRLTGGLLTGFCQNISLTGGRKTT